MKTSGFLLYHETELWTKLVTQDWSAMGQWSDSGYMLHIGHTRSVDTKSHVVKGQMKLYCWKYNGVGK